MSFFMLESPANVPRAAVNCSQPFMPIDFVHRDPATLPQLYDVDADR
jgi:hypothetical protein